MEFITVEIHIKHITSVVRITYYTRTNNKTVNDERNDMKIEPRWVVVPEI